MTATSTTIRKAQAGRKLVEVYPPRRRAASRRRLRSLDLDADDRALVVDTLVTLLEGFYTHLPLKKAMYAVDPVQQLRLLGSRAASMDPVAFHVELARIVTGLRDGHTRYEGPAALAGKAAVLPFLVESYGEADRPRYIVSKVAVADLVGDRRFLAGVELLWWNGMPIDRAVDRHAEDETGGRPDARRARALESLTIRDLQLDPPPDEYWVDVGYLDGDGTEREVRLDWRVVSPGAERRGGGSDGAAAWAVAVDPAAETARQVKKLLFVPDRWYTDRRRATTRRAMAAKPAPKKTPPGEALETDWSDNLTAKAVETTAGVFGYLRLWSFIMPDDADDVAYVDEVVRLLHLLPDRGLIVDLRTNPGGLIWAAERLLQLFTPHPVVPTRFSLLATPLTRAMVEAPQNEWLAEWAPSLHDAVATGELYSQALPITPVERCNDIGQVYGGPVVAVVDAKTYSAGDLFAAGFVDNHLGVLVAAGAQATGAGGANVWWPETIQHALLGTPYSVVPLPAGIGYRLAVRRATRAGAAEGLAIEDVGVRGHHTYPLTEQDLVGPVGNTDLLNHCGRILADQPHTALRVEPPSGGPLQVETVGLDRLDVFVDDRPDGSLDVTDGPTKIDVPAGWRSVEVAGYSNGVLRQRRRLQL